MSTNDGGSAFPNNGSNYEEKYSDPGMTLRDYFAAKAMQAMINNNLDCTTEVLACRAYVVAGAMLRARKR